MPLVPFLLALAVFITYGALFYGSIASFWFSPGWTSDDAMQQVYQFNEALYPGLFDHDFVSNLMSRYLTPIHYWLGIGLTHLTTSPVMTAHWMMFIQIALSLIGMFLLVRGASGSFAVGLIAATWLLHSRPVMQRLTAGLVRGWALPIFCFYLWAATTRRYRLCIAILMIGCFLHPPGTFLIGVTHGIFLLVECLLERKLTKRSVIAVACAPIIAASAWFVTQMPADIGSMITLSEAMNTPEMIRPHGRFAFVPLLPVQDEVKIFAFQVFDSEFFKTESFFRELIPLFVIGAVLVLLGHDFIKRKRLPTETLVPLPIWCFGVALILVYALSRYLAFKLYVPDRHLQLPCAVFFIAAFSIAINRLWSRTNHQSKILASCLAGFLTIVVLVGSGLGLDGTLNFNRSRDQKGKIFAWAKKYTPIESRFAGEPKFIDPMMLWGARKVFISFETAHPFYDKYRTETRRRLDLSLRAHYSTDLAPLMALADEGNDYFVFDRKIFRDLSKAQYGPPFNEMVYQLAAQPEQIFFYFRELADRDPDLVPFADRFALVVNLKVLKARAIS